MAQRHIGRSITRMTMFAAISGVLVACGSGGGSGNGDAEQGGDGEEGTASLRVQAGAVFFEPAYIAVDEGFFAEEGLDVEVLPGTTAAQQIPQVVSGEVDIVATGGVSLIAAVQQGIPVKGILGLQNAVPDPVTSGVLVREDSDIDSYGDLEGKVVGLTALRETTHTATMLAVEDAGVDPESVEFVQLPMPNLNDAVLSGEIDAAYNIGSFYPAGLGMGLRPVEDIPPASRYLEGGPAALWITSTSFLEENQEVVEAFNRAMTKAVEFAKDNPEVVQDLQIEHTEQDPDYIRSAPIQPLTHELDRNGIQSTIDAMVRYGFLPTAPEYDDVIWDGAPHTS